MVFFILCLSGFLYFEYRDAKARGFGWREFKGVTKFLLLGPGPVPKCRVCEISLPDPILREEIGHDAFLCLGCEKEVRLEAGLIRPAWFENKLPPVDAEIVDPLAETKRKMDEWAKQYAKDKADEFAEEFLKTSQGETFPRSQAPGDMTDDWFRQTGENEAVVGNFRPLSDDFEPTGGRPHRRSVPIGETSPHTKRYCDVCKINHPFHGDCPWD